LAPGVRGGAQSDLPPSNRSFRVDGVDRTALIFHPDSAQASKTPAPVVFFFHGHGGRAQGAARRFRIHTLWPGAIVVYMQGLPGVQGITDPQGLKPGWQKMPGELGDRDLKFVDAVLERLQKEYRTDPNRVYAIGHSNGGRFVNVLWKTRGDKFAAFCSASGQGGRLLEGVTPKPIFIIAGERDPLVPFQSQSYSVDLVRKVLQSDQTKAKVDGYARSERGINGTELMTYIHPGGHEFPQDALPMIVSFFQRHTRH